MSITLWKYFSLQELKCRCGKCESIGDDMKAELMEPLIVLRETMDFPFRITSAYRCRTHNNQVSSTGFNGPHTTGCAIDIVIGWGRAYSLLEEAFKMKVFTGIGVQQKGTPRFIHLDTLDPAKYGRPALWSY